MRFLYWHTTDSIYQIISLNERSARVIAQDGTVIDMQFNKNVRDCDSVIILE